MSDMQQWDDAIEELTTTLAVVFGTLSDFDERQWLLQVLDRTARAYPADSLTREALLRFCGKAEIYFAQPGSAYRQAWSASAMPLSLRAVVGHQ